MLSCIDPSNRIWKAQGFEFPRLTEYFPTVFAEIAKYVSGNSPFLFVKRVRKTLCLDTSGSPSIAFEGDEDVELQEDVLS